MRAAVTFGIATPQPAREPSIPQQLRVLWRVERRRDFKVQIVTAALFKHPAPNACELRVFRGDIRDDNALHSEVARFDFTPLEMKAADLRAALLETGWTELRPVASLAVVCGKTGLKSSHNAKEN